MRKLWKNLQSWFTGLDTKDARRGLAGDFNKAFWALMIIIGLSLPGAYSGVFLMLSKAFGLELTALPWTISKMTLVSLVVVAVVIRTVQFLLECDQREKPRKAKSTSKR